MTLFFLKYILLYFIYIIYVSQSSTLNLFRPKIEIMCSLIYTFKLKMKINETKIKGD